MSDHEGQRHVRERQSCLRGECDELLDRIDAALVAQGGEHPRAAQVGLLPASHPSGEHAAGEWAPDHCPHAVALRDRQHLPLDRPVEQRVVRLLGSEALQPAPLGRPLRLDHLRCRHVGRPDRPHLPAAHKVSQRRKGLFDIGLRVRTVHLVQVEMVGPQPTQGVLDGCHDPAPGATLVVRLVADRPGELRSEHDIVPPTLEGASENLLRVAVRIRCVDEVDAGVEGARHHGIHLALVAVAERAEHHCAEREGRNANTSAAERAVVHG